MNASSHTAKQSLDSVIFILDRPQDIRNVGAVVRLLGNFGLSQLRLVGDAAWDPERILTIAHRGAAVIAATQRYDSLPDALADCSFILGTTHRARTIARPILTPRTAARAIETILREQSGAKIAIVFGPEDFGLSNDAIDRCHACITIPTAPHDGSLNLAQAAILIAYELYLTCEEHHNDSAATSALITATQTPEAFATGADIERLCTTFYEMLKTVHRPHIEGRTAATMARMRALLLRAAPRQGEVEPLTRLFTHVVRMLSMQQSQNEKRE